MYPTLFTIGSLPISSFGVLFILGYLIAVFFVFTQGRKDLILIRHNLNEELILDLVISTSFFGFLGARLLHIVFHSSEFGFDPLKLVLFTYFPGLSVLGAVLGALAFLFYVTRQRKVPLFPLLDIAGFGFLLGAPLAFIGGFLGQNVSTIPVFIIEAILLFALFWVLLYMKQKGIIRRDGVVGLTILIIFAIVSFGFEFFRFDRLYIGFLSVNQLLSVLIGFGAAGALTHLKIQTVKTFLRKFNLLW